MDVSGHADKIIGRRYRVVSTTSGGMAVVHFCLDLVQDEFPVALKTFKPEFMPNREYRDRFLREAQIWVNLGFHPNIVQAYRTERFEPGNEVFLVLELVPIPAGKLDPSLRSWLIPGQSLSFKRIFHLSIGIIRGMKYAVEKIPGLVHRDLKPENILILPDGTARVADFGIARDPRSQTFNSQSTISLQCYRLTKGFLGTPRYMSPEQWQNIGVDERSDIYAFGCICYEMTTGQFAINGSSVSEIAQEHISGQAFQMLEGTITEKPMQTFLQKCLHPQPSLRYANWAQVEVGLHTVIDQLYPGFIYPNEAPIDISRFSQLQKASSYIAIGGAYIDLGKFEVGKSFFQQAHSIAKEENELFLVGIALANMGVAAADMGHFQKAVEYYQKAIDIQLEMGDLYHAVMNLGNLGNALLNLHDLPKSKQYLERAYQLAEEIGDLQNQARWKGNLGNLYLASGDFQCALDLFQASINISRSIGDRVTECSSFGGAGQAYENLGIYNKAIEHYRLAASIAEQIGDLQFQGINLLNIGGLMSKNNQLPQSQSCMEQALNISRETNDKLLEAKSLGNMGTVLILTGELDQAILFLEKSINIAEEIDVQDVVARANWSLGLIYEFKRDFNKAIQYLRKAVIEFNRLNMPEYSEAFDHLKTLRKKLGLL